MKVWTKAVLAGVVGAVVLVAGAVVVSGKVPVVAASGKNVVRPADGLTPALMEQRIARACKKGLGLEVGAGWDAAAEETREAVEFGFANCKSAFPVAVRLSHGQAYSQQDAAFILDLIKRPGVTLHLDPAGVAVFRELGYVDACVDAWRKTGWVGEGARVAFELPVDMHSGQTKYPPRITCNSQLPNWAAPELTP